MSIRISKLILCVAAAATFGSACRPNPDAHFKKANAYVEQAKLPEAIVEYRKALQDDPKRADIRQKLAEAYMRNHDTANARKEYVRVADLRPADLTAQVQAGNLLLMTASFEDAKSRAKLALAIDPKSADAQILLGNALAGLKDLDGAVTEYHEAIALNPTRDSAYTDLGVLQLVRGQRAEAEAMFRKAIEVGPKSVVARMALANFLWASRRMPEAEHALKEALALDPTGMAPNRALGTFYVTSGRVKEAEPYFLTIAKGANPAASLTLADYYTIVQRFDDAERVLRGITSKGDTTETYAAATTRLAALLAFQKHRAEALTLLRELLAKRPRQTAARLVMTRVLFADGKKEEALAEANAIIKDDLNAPLTTYAFLAIGEIQTSLDRPEEAIKAYEEVLKRQSRPLSADLGLAALYLMAHSPDKALTYVQAALAIQPDYPPARILHVRVLLAQKDLNKARDVLAGLQKDFPNSTTVLDLVAAQHLSNRQFDAARASYTKAAQIAPDDVEALAGLVNLDLAAGKTADAVKRVEDTLKMVKPTGEILMMAAQTYAATGNPAKAEELLKQAIEVEPARLQAYGMLGQFYVRQRRLDDATRQFQLIATKNPKSVSANTMLGLLLEAQRRLPEAEQQYQKVLAIDSRAAVAANNLAWIYVTSNRNLDLALQLAQAAHSQLTDEPHVNDTLGWIYYRKNMASMAVRHLASSVEKDGNDPMTHYHLGMAYVQVGDVEKGKKELQRALAFKNEFDGATEARKTLAQLGT